MGKSLNQLFKDSWEIYTGHFKYFFLLIVLVTFPVYLVGDFIAPPEDFQPIPIEQAEELNIDNLESVGAAFIDGLKEGYESVVSTDNMDPWQVWFVPMYNVFISIIGMFVSIGLVWGTWQILETKATPDLSTALSASLKLFWPVFLTSFIAGILLIPLFLFFVLPGVIFAVYWAFTTAAVIVMKKKYWTALSYSRSLVKGRWIDVFLRLLVIGALMIAVALVLSISLSSLAFYPGLRAMVDVIIQIIAAYGSIFTTLYFFDLVKTKKEPADSNLSSDSVTVS